MATPAPLPPIARPVAAVCVGSFMGWAMGGGPGAAAGGVLGLALASMAPPARQGLTEDRERLYRRAMRSDSVSPDAVDKLADAFEREHLTAHAVMLRRRASALRLTPEQAAERRRLFMRGLAAGKADAVSRLAASYRAEGSLLAGRELAQHARDLRALAAGKVDAATVARLEQRLALVRETFGASPQTASATANLDAARAALTQQEPTP